MFATVCKIGKHFISSLYWSAEPLTFQFNFTNMFVVQVDIKMSFLWYIALTGHCILLFYNFGFCTTDIGLYEHKRWFSHFYYAEIHPMYFWSELFLARSSAIYMNWYFNVKHDLTLSWETSLSSRRPKYKTFE